MNGKIISAILVLALASMACGFSIDLPKQVKAGPEIKDSITVADPKPALSGAEVSEETRLNITFGAGDLTLSSGAQNLVDGTVLYNVKDLKPEVTNKDGKVNITVTFNDPVRGQNSRNAFALEFMQDNLFRIFGNVWEVMLPTIGNTSSYQVVVHLPDSTHKKISIAKPKPDSIEGNKIIVWNSEFKNPRYVRYNWADNPDGNLYNKEGLPASAFENE